MAKQDKTDKSDIQTNKLTDIQLTLAETKLNQAAADLLTQLPDHAGQLVHSLAKQYQMPLWQYTAGILLAVHLEGRLSEFRIDPAWRDGMKTKTLKCKHCGEAFVPRHINQPYCSNICGLAAVEKLIPRNDKETLKNDPIPDMSRAASIASSANMAWSQTAALAD